MNSRGDRTSLEQRLDAAAREVADYIPFDDEQTSRALAGAVLTAAGVEQLAAAAETYRRTLWRIADAESGVWGKIAHDALADVSDWAPPT